MSEIRELLAQVEGPLTGAPSMIGLRGDLSDQRIVAGIAKATGLTVPAPRRITRTGARSLGWMSPDELILMLPAADLADVLAEALSGLHHLVVDVSDMRAIFDVIGPRADQVLQKLTPADLTAVADDELRRSRVAQVAAAFWRVDGGWRLICFRSIAVYMRDLLDNAAQAGGELDPQ